MKQIYQGLNREEDDDDDDDLFNLKTSNVNYSWRTAPLTSKVAF